MSKSLGKMLEKLRKEREINQKELSHGICSVTTLSRMEKGEREPDQMLFDCLMSRLGKDSTKWELVLKENDRRLFSLRSYIEYFIQMEEWNKLEEVKNLYTNFDGVSEQLQEQYLCLIQAILYKEKKEYDLALQFCLEGLEKTKIQVDLDTFKIQERFSRNELRLLFLMGEILFYQGKTELTTLCNYCNELLGYIEKFCTDEQYRLKFSIQARYYLANILYHQQQYQECIAHFQNLIKEIREKRSLYYLKPILKLAEQLKEMDLSVINDLSKEEIRILIKTLEEWECENKKLQEKEQYIRTNNSIYSINEIIKNARNLSGKTQEEMIGMNNRDGVVGDQKGLSYIENGKRNPRKETSSYYLEQLGLSGKEEGFQLAINGEDFEIQEMRFEIDFCISTHKISEAEKLLSILKRKMDLSDPQNEQYVREIELYIRSEREDIPTKEREKELFSILSLTISNLDKIIKEKEAFRFLTREELFLVMNLGCAYHQNGDHQTALEYYKRLEKYFSETYQLASGSIYKTLLYNMSQVNGLLGNYNESMKKSRGCIFIGMLNFEGNNLCRAIYNIGWCYGTMMLEEKNSQKKEQYKKYCKHFFRQSSMIAKFYQDEIVVEGIEKIIVEWEIV